MPGLGDSHVPTAVRPYQNCKTINPSTSDSQSPAIESLLNVFRSFAGPHLQLYFNSITVHTFIIYVDYQTVCHQPTNIRSTITRDCKIFTVFFVVSSVIKWLNVFMEYLITYFQDHCSYISFGCCTEYERDFKATTCHLYSSVQKSGWPLQEQHVPECLPDMWISFFTTQKRQFNIDRRSCNRHRIDEQKTRAK